MTNRSSGKLDGVIDTYAGFFLTPNSAVDVEVSTLMMAGTEGIIGNVVLQDRRVGYAPRRGVLVL